MRKPRRLETREVARYRYLALFEHELEESPDHPGTGAQTVVTLELSDWCSAAARRRDGRWVLVRQHRHGVDAATLEVAGGIVDDGEDPAAAAARELLEESGHRAARAVSLGWVHPNPALSANRSHLYFFDDVEEIAAPERHHDEETDVVLLDEGALDEALLDGTISHALAVVALERALRYVRTPGGGRA